jgi:hypothetical protein
MAWSSIRDGQWHKVWQPASKEATDSLMSVLAYPYEHSQGGPVHVVLKDGMIVAGTVAEQGCQGEHSAKALQRRDHSLKLHLQPCKVNPGGFCSLREDNMTFHPSQWICAVPSAELQIVKGDALSRLAEIAEMLGFAQTSHGLHGIVAMLKCQFAQMPMPMPMVPACYSGMVWWVRPISTGQGQTMQSSESNFGFQYSQALRMWRPSDKLGDLESEESTRASDNESHSSTRSHQFPHGRAKQNNNHRNANATNSRLSRHQEWKYIHGIRCGQQTAGDQQTAGGDQQTASGQQIAAPRGTKSKGIPTKKTQRQVSSRQEVESR